jgi:hypothetical protein
VLRHPIVRLLLAALCGAAAAFALLGVVRLVNPGDGFERTTAATGYGWLLPILLGIVCVVLVRLLMRESPERMVASTPDSRVCRVCGGKVLDSWRLCPHCGESLTEQDPEAVTD